jgi:hypothetical protein
VKAQVLLIGGTHPPLNNAQRGLKDGFRKEFIPKGTLGKHSGDFCFVARIGDGTLMARFYYG